MGWFNFVGKTFGENRPVEEVGDPPDFEPGILADTGIAYVQFLKKLLIPSWARIENVKQGCYKTKPQETQARQQSCATKCNKKTKSEPARHPGCKSRPNCPIAQPPQDHENKCCRKPIPPELKLPCAGDLKTPTERQSSEQPTEPAAFDNSSKCGQNMQSRTTVICESCQKCSTKVECVPKDKC